MPEHCGRTRRHSRLRLDPRVGTHQNIEAANGPGKLTRALGISRAVSGHDLLQPPLTVRELGPPMESIATSPRIGIRRCEDWPLRFFLQGNPHVSR